MIVAQELIHTLRKKRFEKYESVTLELDMRRAFDRVEWPFFKAFLGRMGFPSKFIQIIMTCISSVCYFIVVNGETCGEITPTREFDKGTFFPLTYFFFAVRAF